MASFPTNATYTLSDIEYSMADKKPDKGYSFTREFLNAKFTSQIGYERRRQLSRRPSRKFSLSYTNVHSGYKLALENFYNNRGGDYESFEFDLSYINQNGTILVRFDSTLNISSVLATSDDLNTFYNVSFTLIEVVY